MTYRKTYWDEEPLLVEDEYEGDVDVDVDVDVDDMNVDYYHAPTRGYMPLTDKEIRYNRME